MLHYAHHIIFFQTQVSHIYDLIDQIITITTSRRYMCIWRPMRLPKWQFYEKHKIFECLYSNYFHFILIVGKSTIEINLANKQEIIAGKLFFSFIIFNSVKSNAVKKYERGQLIYKSVLIY